MRFQKCVIVQIVVNPLVIAAGVIHQARLRQPRRISTVIVPHLHIFVDCSLNLPPHFLFLRFIILFCFIYPLPIAQESFHALFELGLCVAVSNKLRRKPNAILLPRFLIPLFAFIALLLRNFATFFFLSEACSAFVQFGAALEQALFTGSNTGAILPVCPLDFG